eukprot:2406790-Amphidinium_carterae.2
MPIWTLASAAGTNLLSPHTTSPRKKLKIGGVVVLAVVHNDSPSPAQPLTKALAANKGRSSPQCWHSAEHHLMVVAPRRTRLKGSV